MIIRMRLSNILALFTDAEDIAHRECNEECLGMRFNDLLRMWVLIVRHSITPEGNKGGGNDIL